jgi:recA bacterial DNA recombination protein
MSSFPLFSTEVVRRPVAAASAKFPALSERLSSLSSDISSASHLEVRPAPEMVSSGIAAIDALTGGLPRGRLTEICGVASSGRTSLALATLAAATRRQEACALVDVSDVFDPASAAMAEVQFERLLWVRCGASQQNLPRRHRGTEKKRELFNAYAETPVEQALRVTDLLLQSGGFGLVMIDLGDVPFKIARRIPLASWFRFQRAVEHTPTVLFVITPAPCTQSSASLLVRVQAPGKKLSAVSSQLSGKSPAHAELLDGLHIEGELLRSRLERKPVQSASATFATKVRVS